MRRSLALTVAAVAAGTLAIGASADTRPTARVAAKAITPERVGQVHLGDTHSELREKELVGFLRPGCELAENTRSARLRPPLRGSVNYTQSNPRRVTDIQVRGGAKARGVGIGARIPDIKDAFPKAKVIRRFEDSLGLTFVRVPKNGGGRIQFGLPVETQRVTLIGVPFIAVCD
jgi:hypothetical protein